MAEHVVGSLDGSESFDQELQAVIAPPGALYRMDTTSVDLSQGQSPEASATPGAAAAAAGPEAAAPTKEAAADPPSDSKEPDKSKEPWNKSNDPVSYTHLRAHET